MSSVNDKVQERAIDRIRKLLRLSQSMYQAETELAMQRAFELAANTVLTQSEH